MATNAVQPGQILLVNGTSGSGKSSTCERFVRRADDFWLLYGIDHFLSATWPPNYSHHGPKAHEGYYAEPWDSDDPDGPLRWSFGEQGWAGFHALHEWVAAASRSGCNVVLDHLVMSDPPVLEDLVRRLEGLPVVFVSLHPPIEVLEERVASRVIDKRQPAAEMHGAEEGARRALERLNRLRPFFYDSVYRNKTYDLEIDTSVHDIDEVCALIEARLAEGPGTAFDELRRAHAWGS